MKATKAVLTVVMLIAVTVGSAGVSWAPEVNAAPPPGSGLIVDRLAYHAAGRRLTFRAYTPGASSRVVRCTVNGHRARDLRGDSWSVYTGDWAYPGDGATVRCTVQWRTFRWKTISHTHTVHKSGPQTSSRGWTRLSLGGNCNYSSYSGELLVSCLWARSTVVYRFSVSKGRIIKLASAGMEPGLYACHTSISKHNYGKTGTITAVTANASGFAQCWLKGAWAKVGTQRRVKVWSTHTIGRSRNVTVPGAAYYSLGILISGTGSGTVTGDTQSKYAPGTLVNLTASPAADSDFTGWGGACSGTALTCGVTMNGNKSVTATFDLMPPPSPTGPTGP